MSTEHQPSAANEFLARALARAANVGRQNLAFAERIGAHPGLAGAAKTPWYHQLRRIRAALEQPAILVADETGLGKTAVVVQTKLYLDIAEHDRTAILDPTHATDGAPSFTRVPTTAIILCTHSGMRDPWNEEEINAYVPSGFPRQRVHHMDDKRSLNALMRAFDAGEPPDFVVVNHDKLAFPRYADALARMAAHERVSLVAVDECHELRNPGAKRFAHGVNGSATGFVAILRAIRARATPPKLIHLSATPIANLPEDLGVILHTLDPSIGIRAARAIQRTDVMRWFFWKNIVFRIEKQHVQELLGLAPMTETTVTVRPNDAEIAAYARTWQQVVMCGSKLHRLAKAMFTAKLRYLEAAVPQWRAEGKQVAIFTRHCTNITDVLAARLGGAWIDGNVDTPQRTAHAQAFRSGALPIIVATTGTCAESISFACGDHPCVIVQLEPFFTPHETIQSTGRVWRPGQRAPVEVVTLIAQSPELSAAIEEASRAVEARLCIQRTRSWSPTSYDEDAYAINGEKRRAAEKVYTNAALSQEEQQLLSNKEHELGLTSIKFDSPAHRACMLQGKWIGRGWKYFLEHVTPSEQFAEWIADYNAHWEFSASAHTWRLIRRIIETIERRGRRPLARIVDQGAGPGCAIRMLKRSMTAVDLSERMLAVAQEEVDRLNSAEGTALALERVARPLHDCGLPDAHVDLATAAYVLQYAQQLRKPETPEDRELESITMETNRILRRGGYWIVALPYNVNGRMIQRFETMVASYGFDVLPASGFYKPTHAEDRDGKPRRPNGQFTGAWITVARKRANARELVAPAPQGLTFRKVVISGGKHKIVRPKRQKRFLPPMRITEFAHASGRRIEELLR